MPSTRSSYSGLSFGVLFAAILAGCGGAQQHPELSYSENARLDFEKAELAVRDDDCITATPMLQNVRREYPYSRYAAQAELLLADCEMQQDQYTEAIRSYRAFIRQRPTHPQIDKANFSIAQAYYRQIPRDFFLSPPPAERDQTQTRSALRIVRRFLAEYPESEYREEAVEIEKEVLALLARHELFAANYYLDRDYPHATIARLETLLNRYEGSGVEPEALILLGRVYLRVEDPTEASTAFRRLVDEFPESGFAVQARNYLAFADAASAPHGEESTPSDPEESTSEVGESTSEVGESTSEVGGSTSANEDPEEAVEASSEAHESGAAESEPAAGEEAPAE